MYPAPRDSTDSACAASYVKSQVSALARQAFIELRHAVNASVTSSIRVIGSIDHELAAHG
jgi:hypothetical protein